MSKGVFLACGWAFLGCSQAVSPPRAELGVFYGGQLQELRRVPLSATPEQERYGFQIEWARPLTHALPIDWEILRPARSQAGLPIPAQAEVGREELASGQSQFRKVFSFGAAAPLGTWNFRVLVDRHLVLDRAIEVYEPSAQRRVSKNPG